MIFLVPSFFFFFFFNYNFIKLATRGTTRSTFAAPETLQINLHPDRSRACMLEHSARTARGSGRRVQWQQPDWRNNEFYETGLLRFLLFWGFLMLDVGTLMMLHHVDEISYHGYRYRFRSCSDYPVHLLLLLDPAKNFYQYGVPALDIKQQVTK